MKKAPATAASRPRTQEAAQIREAGERVKRAPTASETIDRILRFKRSERLLHWSIAIPFLVCYATAVILVSVYNPFPQRPYRELFSWVHRVSGVCLAVFPVLTLAIHWRDYRIHLYNIRQGWVWTLKDLKWLSLMGLAAISKKITLPEQGKFNAAEKINFMMVMCSYSLFIVTGLLIWRPGVAFFAWVIHVSLAIVVTPLLFGHIFMATVNPDTRVGLQGMISGWVDRKWAKHHYRAWYRENFEPHRVEESVCEPVPSERPQQALPLVRCSSCKAEYVVPSWSHLIDSALAMQSLECPDCGADSPVSWVMSDSHKLEWILSQLERAGDEILAAPGGSGEPSLQREVLPLPAATEGSIGASDP